MTHKNKSMLTLIACSFVLFSALLIACGNKQSKMYTIGVINVVPSLDYSVKGFKEGMAELGYIEGKNIRYIYDGATVDITKIDAKVRSLVDADIDLLVCLTTTATKAAKKITAGRNLPVVFFNVTDPVGAGIVNSLRQPGGNITGVTFGLQEVRRLEWLLRIAPHIKKIYVPYNPDDKSPVLSLRMIEKIAPKLGIELITRKFRSHEELIPAVINIPKNANGVFLLPDSLLFTRIEDIVNTANTLGLPTSGATIDFVKTRNVLTTYGYDQMRTGKQAARLADQIFQGTRPSDLPVEIAEFYLAINLKVAKRIDLDIPDNLLKHADIIIR